jgi:hypothetical protein
VPGRNITANLTDPYMGPASHVINDPSVSVNLSRSTGFYWRNVALNIGAFVTDFTRALYQMAPSGRELRMQPTYFNLPHTEMDNLAPFGALMP